MSSVVYAGRCNSRMANDLAISYFQAAREHYIARRFDKARVTMHRYREVVDYGKFEQNDLRANNNPVISVIIVSFKTNLVLLDCLDSIFRQQGPSFEIILVDNGGNESIQAELIKQSLLWIRPLINLLPSEGRNVGAHFARSDILVFLDDDACMAPGYFAAAMAIADKKILGLRGRVLPKTAHTTIPKHYDMGDQPRFAEFNFEGNMVIRTEIYRSLCGFDPLMFGHEGKELTQRARHHFPGQEIMYAPDLIVRHDWAQNQRLSAKRERQSLGMAYLNYLQENSLNAGISILIRAGENLTFAEEFLTSLVEHNTYKPVEVLLWANNSQKALATSRNYLSTFFVRILPASTRTLGRVSQQARYDNILIVDLPTKLKSDLLPELMKQQRTNLKTVLVYNKKQHFGLIDTLMTVSLDKLAARIGKPTSLNPITLTCQYNKSATKDTLELQENELIIKKSIQIKNTSSDPGSIKLSVVIPVYNKAKTINKAFISVLNSGRNDIEYIFVDDMSTDNSRVVIEEISKNHKNVVSVFNTKNVGAGASRNIGVKKAKGDYVFFLDADDQINGSALSELIHCADTNGADLVRGKIKGVKSSGMDHQVAKQYLLHEYDDQRIGVRWQEESSLWFYWYFYSNLYRRSFLNNNHIRFPEAVRNEDPLFLCKCYLYANKIALHPSIVYSYTLADTQQRRTGVDFLNGWVYNYYAIYQLICANKIQTAFFLCHFPSLVKHCKAITNSFDDKNVLRLLNCISVMYKNFNTDVELLKKHISDLLPRLNSWEEKDLCSTLDFASAISGKSGACIFRLLNQNNFCI